jgi:hypothetical protein
MMKMKLLLKSAPVILAAGLIGTGISIFAPRVAAIPQYLAQSSSTPFNVERQVAIRGTDPVAYFRQGRPQPGQEAFAYEWMNAPWLFASADNRDLFIADPQRFAPQFGGFCAYAVSQGYTAPIDPNAWSIVDGKLYLNLNLNVQRLWERNREQYIRLGHQNWPGIKERLLMS